MNYTEKEIIEFGNKIILRDGEGTVTERTFRCFYGRNGCEILQVWEMIQPFLIKAKLKHLFWTMMYMKLYLPYDVMVTLVNTSNSTFMNKVWMWIDAISKLHTKVILWKNRNRNLPPNVWCRVTIDGTDFQIDEPVPFDKSYKSPKAKGAAVKYEVAISIYSGDIVWIHGPHVGSKNDLTIFREKLKYKLDPEEMAEVDAGYKGETDFLRSRDVYTTEKEKREKSEMRARHETVNRRFKQWQILKQQFRNDRKKHKMVFYAIATLTQIEISNGNVPFSVQPSTKKLDHYHI